MNCPNGHPLDFVAAMQELVDYHKEVADNYWPRFLNIWCDGCKGMPLSIWIERNDGQSVTETTHDATEGKDVVFDYPKKRMP